MKEVFRFIFILTAVVFANCSPPAIGQSPSTTLKPNRVEKVDDSTICHSYNMPDGDTEMFYISNGDTISHIIAFVDKFYSNYTFYNKDKKVLKIEQYLQPIGIDERINEIVHFNPDGTIDTTKSHLLTFEDQGDSICIHADKSALFNKTRIIIGDSNNFDYFSWKTPDRFESGSPYVTISKSITGRKCVFQRITTDTKDMDIGGYDIYFDLENLLCRDVSKTLVCRAR